MIVNLNRYYIVGTFAFFLICCSNKKSVSDPNYPELKQSDQLQTQNVLNTKKLVLNPSYLKSDSTNLTLPQALKVDGKFQNIKSFELIGLYKSMGLLSRILFEEDKDGNPTKPIPLDTQKVKDLKQISIGQVEITRLGHSSILLRNATSIWLIDPVFSERASPVTFAGPKRFHEVPLDYQNLKKIEGIIISHDHYDHLDEKTIRELHTKVNYFAVPEGVGAILKEWGVDSSKIHEFVWWDQMNLGSLTITSAPAQHFSGRSLFGRMETLWCGWSIQSGKNKIFYTGDGGYQKEFKLIGEVLGPFDLALIETGAYDKDWPYHHMTPEQSIQAFIDLKAKAMMPVHNGTFDLAFHPWYDPFEKIYSIAVKENIPLVLPLMGKSFTLDNIPEPTLWWKNLN
jgi:L-ascorbate metabolism protein UlaG (beta-lactamase superfamily)